MQRRVPSRRARPFSEAFSPIFRHEPLPVFDQTTVAPSSVPVTRQEPPTLKFTITHQSPLIDEQQLVPCQFGMRRS